MSYWYNNNNKQSKTIWKFYNSIKWVARFPYKGLYIYTFMTSTRKWVADLGICKKAGMEIGNNTYTIFKSWVEEGDISNRISSVELLMNTMKIKK